MNFNEVGESGPPPVSEEPPVSVSPIRTLGPPRPRMISSIVLETLRGLEEINHEEDDNGHEVEIEDIKAGRIVQRLLEKLPTENPDPVIIMRIEDDGLTRIFYQNPVAKEHFPNLRGVDIIGDPQVVKNERHINDKMKVDRDGEIFYYRRNLVNYPLTLGNKKYQFVLVYLYDITDRENAYRVIQNAHGELERAHKAEERRSKELERANAELEKAHAELERKNAEIRRVSEELRKKAAKLYEDVIHDKHTGLFNKPYFIGELQQSVARVKRYKGPLGVIMLDVDFFKKINDTFGHLAGDAVLKRIARILAETIREADILCRFGGDEFCIMCPETNIDDTRVLAERLRKEVESKSFRYKEERFSISISLGVTAVEGVNGFDFSSDQVLEASDKALLRAKEQGRNRVKKQYLREYIE